LRIIRRFSADYCGCLSLFGSGPFGARSHFWPVNSECVTGQFVGSEFRPIERAAFSRDAVGGGPVPFLCSAKEKGRKERRAVCLAEHYHGWRAREGPSAVPAWDETNRQGPPGRGIRKKHVLVLEKGGRPPAVAPAARRAKRSPRFNMFGPCHRSVGNRPAHCARTQMQTAPHVGRNIRNQLTARRAAANSPPPPAANRPVSPPMDPGVFGSAAGVM